MLHEWVLLCLMASLGVHAGHAQYEPQDNKFAVFPQFWEIPQYAVPSEQMVSGRWVCAQVSLDSKHATCMYENVFGQPDKPFDVYAVCLR